MLITCYKSRRKSLMRSEILTTKAMNLNVSLDHLFIYTVHLTRSINRQTNTCTLLIFYLLKHLKFLKTLLHVSVIRPSSGSL